ncbi:MAG: hypothetical protein DRQ01_07225 [Ignavibacteriae bacterium]|nr:MAG: hypothetical protein DRQ01_07225 [Ignavibacteriota bacterium]
MKTLYKLVIPAFLFLIIICEGCGAAKTEIIGEWQEESYKKGEIDKVLVLGIVDIKKPLLRRKFEDGIKEVFQKNGIEAIASMDEMPYDEVVSEGSFDKYFKDLNIDAVIVSRLVGIEETKDFKAGYLYTIPFNSYYGFYGYYYAGIQYANSTGYLSKNMVVVLETNIYETNERKLIWSGISETVDPDKASDVIRSFGNALVSKLYREGYFK